MENRGDSSIWRSLAVAFGDGLAFGVGMSLTRSPGRHEALPQVETGVSPARLENLELRLAEMEKAPARLDQRVLEALVNGLEEQLRERDGQWAGRLAGSVESAAQAMRREFDDKTAALDDAVEQKLASFAMLLEQRGREVAALRQCLAASDRRTRELLRAVAEICHRAAEQFDDPAGAGEEMRDRPGSAP